MNIQDIINRQVKINRSTITVLNSAGKTAGMITGVETFYNMPQSKQFTYDEKVRRLGIDRHKMDWKRMFYIKGAWYYLADDRALARAYEFKAMIV